MKPDEKYFPVLTNPEEWGQWWKDLHTISLATGMDACMNFAGAPQPGDPDHGDFIRRNRWFYYILTKTVKTNEGKAILDRHNTAGDGRAALHEIYHKCLNSGASGVSSQTRMEELIGMRIDKGYSKPYTHFINNFLRRAQQYNDLQTDHTARFTEGFIMTLLQNAVSGVPALAQLRARERHEVAMGRPSYDFARYTLLLKDEAERLDGLRRKNRHDRSANVHELFSAEDSSEEDNALYQAFKTALQRVRRDESSPGWMDNKVFSKLTPEAKSTWNKIPETDRQTILDGFRQVNFSQLTEDGGGVQ